MRYAIQTSKKSLKKMVSEDKHRRVKDPPTLGGFYTELVQSTRKVVFTIVLLIKSTNDVWSSVKFHYDENHFKHGKTLKYSRMPFWNKGLITEIFRKAKIFATI